MRRSVIVSLAVLAASLALAVEAVDHTGLPVGSKAPAFQLPDQVGKSHTLQEFLDAGTVAVVFYRSADW
jgi:hypothetical protein